MLSATPNTYDLRGFIYMIYGVSVIERNYDHEHELAIEQIQEFTCFSVKNGSVKVILSSDKFTTAIYVLSVVKRKLFALSVIEPECQSLIGH